MDHLPPDIVRKTALNLSVRDIFNLCQTNKRLQQIIWKNKSFWEALFLREVKESVDIPATADIKWFKEKIKIYPAVKKIADLIRKDKVRYEFILPRRDKKSNDGKDFNKMSSFEIIENLKELSCQFNRLTSLPPMPNLKILFCHNNQLTSLPPLPNLEVLYCSSNRLTSLSLMPKLTYLSCENNQLISLPPISNLKEVNCENNQLTSLSSMPKLRYLDCHNNPLPFFTLREWITWWNSTK